MTNSIGAMVLPLGLVCNSQKEVEQSAYAHFFLERAIATMKPGEHAKVRVSKLEATSFLLNLCSADVSTQVLKSAETELEFDVELLTVEEQDCDVEPEQSEKLILEAAAKINEAGGKLVTDKKHKDPFNALVGIWCYWNVYSHLAERSAPLLKRERNVAVLKALNNLFKMLKDKVGMSNDKFALGSRSFPFIDQITNAAAVAGVEVAAGTVIKETGFAFKSFCQRIEVAVVSCERHEDLKKDKEPGRAAGPKRLLNKAESLIEKHPKFFADKTWMDMLAKAQEAYDARKSVIDAEWEAEKAATAARQAELARKKQENKDKKKAASLAASKKLEEVRISKIDETEDGSIDGEEWDALTYLAAGATAIAAVGGAYAWWKSKK